MTDRAQEAMARVHFALRELGLVPERALTAVEARIDAVLGAPWKSDNYGFEWGPMEVMRAMEHRGTHVLLIKTDTHELEVAVSPKGNSVRVWLDRKKMEVPDE